MLSIPVEGCVFEGLIGSGSGGVAAGADASGGVPADGVPDGMVPAGGVPGGGVAAASPGPGMRGSGPEAGGPEIREARFGLPPEMLTPVGFVLVFAPPPEPGFAPLAPFDPPATAGFSPGRAAALPFAVGSVAGAPPGTPGRVPSGEMETCAERLPAGTLISGETGAGLAERAIKRRVSDSLPVTVVPRSGGAPASEWRAEFGLGADAEAEGIFTSRGRFVLPATAPFPEPLFLISGGAPASELRAEFALGAAVELVGIFTSGG